MTFIISDSGVENTEGTSVTFGPAQVRVGGGFTNSGVVEIDNRASLDIAGNVVNSGNFSIKDYVAESQYNLIEHVLTDPDVPDDAKGLLSDAYSDLQSNKSGANGKFRSFINYFKAHPELITGSVQILLQAISLK